MNIMKVAPYTADAVDSSGAADGKSGTSTASGTSGSTSDQVQLSQNYKELANVRKSISGAEEVRTDKVQEVQNQLSSGTYQINAGGIAEKMMSEIL